MCASIEQDREETSPFNLQRLTISTGSQEVSYAAVDSVLRPIHKRLTAIKRATRVLVIVHHACIALAAASSR